MQARRGQCHGKCHGERRAKGAKSNHRHRLVLVIKFGGNAMTPEAEATLLRAVAEKRQAGEQIVLVHGGGPQIDAELMAKGISTQRIDGLRITDAPTLAVTEAVLCGTINKRLVRALRTRGIDAVGISGQDAGLLTCIQTSPELAYVGTVITVNATVIHALLTQGLLPVIAPLGIAANGSTAYNINADTAAGAIAGALKADALIFITNVDKLRSDPTDTTTGIDKLTLTEAIAFAATPACGQAMKPKLAAAIAALQQGATTATIASNLNGGTTIVSC
jgi:acetylglutamate kinase